MYSSCLTMSQILIELKLSDSFQIVLHSWKRFYWTGVIQLPILSLCNYPLALQHQKIIEFSFRQQIFVSEGRGPRLAADGRVLFQTAVFCFRQPHFASDSRILLRTAAICFWQMRFTSDSRVLLRTAVFCFGLPGFVLEGHVLLKTAAFGIRQLRLPWDRYSKLQTKAYSFASQGGCFTSSPGVSHLFERPYVMHLHQLCRTYHQN